MGAKIESCPNCNSTVDMDIETECEYCGMVFEKDAVCNNPFCGTLFDKENNPYESDEEQYECKCPICSAGYISPDSDLSIQCNVCWGYYNSEEYSDCPWCSD